MTCGYGPNRFLCSVLDEMRTSLKMLNNITIDRYKKLTELMIEEIQMHANIMEANLSDVSDVQKLLEKRRTLKKQVRELEKKRDTLQLKQDSETVDEEMGR